MVVIVGENNNSNILDTGVTRTFSSGATRDTAANKPDYEGFLSPLVIEEYGRYMTRHRVQSDGSLRASDNWQKGIPRNVYAKSLWRHMLDFWKAHRGWLKMDAMPLVLDDVLKEALCAIMFNAMGYLHELLIHREE